MTLDVTRFMTNSERVSAQLKKLRGEAVAFGQGFSRTFSLAFGLVAAAAIKTAAGFDQLQAQLQAVTSGQGLSLLESEAKRLGRTTVFTATQVANLQLELAKLGFGTREVVGGVQAATRITAVFGGDLVKTGTTIAEAVRQFSNENLNATRVADVMAVAFKETALSTENFGQAMKNVGSVANITGNDFETTVALLGLLANAGQKGGIAGTRLKGVMIRLGKQFGVTGQELQLLTSGQLDFNQLIEIFRNRAGVAAAVISEMGEEFQVLKQKLLDSRGAAAALESALNDRLFFSLKRIEAASESAGITIGEAFAPTLLSLADSFQSFAEFLEDADKGTIRMVASIGTFLAVLPIVVFLVTQVGTALAATFLSAPGLIAATIAAIVSLGIASKVEIGKTLGVLNNSREGFLKITQDLKKFAQEGAEQVSGSLKVLNEELDKVATDDRLGTVEKIEATQRLTTAIERTSDTLNGLESFGTNQLQDSFKNFARVVDRNTRRIRQNLTEIDDLQSTISNRTAELRELGLENNLGVAQEQIGDEKQRSIALILDNADSRAEIDAYLNLVKTRIDDLDLSIFSSEQLAAQETEIELALKRIDEALATANAQKGTPFQNFFTDLGTGFRQDGAMLVAELDALFSGAGFLGEGGAFEADAKILEEFAPQYRTIENILSEIAQLDADRVVQADLLAKFQEESAKRLEEQLAAAKAAQFLAEGFGGIFSDDASAKESIEAFDKLKEALKGVVAEFGNSSGDINSVQDDIASLARESLDLRDVLFTQDSGLGGLLGEEFDDEQGSIEDRKKAIDGIVKSIDDFIVKSVAAGKVDLALLFVETNKAYKDLQASLDRELKIEGLREASASAESLNKFLSDRGITESLAFARSEVSRLTTLISGLQGQGVVDQDALDLLAFYNKEVQRLSAITQTTNFKIDLGLADGRLITQIDKLNAKIRLLGDDSAAEVDKLAKSFNALPDKANLIDDAFSLGDGTALIDVQKIEQAIAGLVLESTKLDTSSDEFAEVNKKIDEYVAFRNQLLETNDAIRENALAMGELGESIQDFAGREAFQDTALGLEQVTDQLTLGFIKPLQAAQSELSILQDLMLRAFNNEDVLAGSGFTMETLQSQLATATATVERLERINAIVGVVQQQMSFIGDAFVEATTDGKDFFESLKEGFLKMFTAIIGKLITLIAVFAILSIFIPGFGAAVGGLGGFIGAGFGIPGGGTKSAMVGGPGMGGSSQLALGGRISGNNIVLANERGTRAMDRTFG
jgi:hypothetical protein